MAPQLSRPVRVARALLSVSDKSGLVELARGLARHGVELVASGGTATALRDAGLAVVEVAELTQSPEMLGGRVKTLHPRIHGGLLARRELASDRQDMDANGIRPIDLVVVNLYPFEQTVAKPGVSLEDAIENIDIGGPSMIRSAAKNHAHVAVLTDPADYAAVLAELDANGGALGEATRRSLAVKAFARTGAYDGAIHAWLSKHLVAPPAEETFPERLHIDLPRAQSLRYGENPHQGAALYGGFLEAVESLHGKELSFNNVVDAQAALSLILDFDPADETTLAILKHNTPCGVGAGATPLDAWKAAFATDPDSPFGGIIVVNRAFDLALAQAVDEIFTEVLIAPEFAPDALAFLRKKKNRRLLRYRPERIDRSEPDVRRVFGGLLVQQPDLSHETVAAAQVVTQRKPSEDELRALAFGWKVVKHVKSNAIVFARADRTLAIGGGQTSRVDAVHVASAKAARVGNALAGSVVASDAFFPFPDGLETAVAAGAGACVQPGGSARDAEVIAAADRLGIAMVFTGARHFRH
ncbi:MAG: bifunctional phosphoribosylaminoimidazolecarboxamide formyltransferase/inosine monophosphate cyclohydrolase [Proteobacteria bacterium]|nr:MAG: bifunctional phosphoribosylaminoimidazolecarboxamide formyltransferase/inosine monophosphate cyclohydrolase [Pseudomonadota bacterium]